MKTQTLNNTKVGIFVIAGLFGFMLALYLIGSNRNVFGSGFQLTVHFAQLNGLEEGNNVLFSGIQAGTVKNITMLNDTVIEVVLTLDNKIKEHIHKNALATIGSEGLMGNKIINISNVPGENIKVDNGDLLTTQRQPGLDAMISKLSKTNDNIELISEALKRSIIKIDSGNLLAILSDRSLGTNIKTTLFNFRDASTNVKDMTHTINSIVAQIKNGKGSAGMLLTDTTIAGNLKIAIANAKGASLNADNASSKANEMISNLNYQLTNGKGPLSTLLRDSSMSSDMKTSMQNIRRGTAGFNDNMEALKHNFLLRGFFKKKEKSRQDSLRKITAK